MKNKPLRQFRPALLALLLTLTAISCADYPEGAQEPGRAIQPDMRFEAAEDTVLTVAAEAGILVQIQEADPETWTVASTGTLTSDNGGTVAMESDGAFTYTPAADFEGPDYLHIRIASGTGGEGAYIVLFEVAGSNDAPRPENDVVRIEEDTSVRIRPLENDVDVDNGDTIALVSVAPPLHGNVIIEAEEVVVYTPPENFAGNVIIPYTIADASGSEATALIEVEITPVDDAPRAEADAYGGTEDSILVVPAAEGVLLNDSDFDNDSEGLSAEAGGFDTAQGGSVLMAADGGFTYTPAPDFNGEDSFIYTLIDMDGGTAGGKVTISVAPVNDPPTAMDDEATTDEDTALTLTPLSNDSDVDAGDDIAVVSVDDPDHGSVAADLETGEIFYTPEADFFGEDGFSYSIADAAGEAASARVTITVAPVNDAPVAAADTFTGEEDQPLSVSAAAGVLGNDTDVDDDVADLVVAAATMATDRGGSVVMRTDGGFTYTPMANFNGEDGFTYTVSDGELEAQGSVTLTVAAVNDAPSAVNDSYAAEEDTPLTIPAAEGLLRNDSDIDGDALAVVSGTVTTARGGSAALAADGGFTYTPAGDFFGADSFQYRVSDGHGGRTSATVTLAVAGVEDPPVAVDDAASVDEGGAVTIEVLANDSDPDVSGTDTLTIVSTSQGSFGTVSVNGGRSVTYTHIDNDDFDETDTFTYTISDGDDEATATVTVTIGNVNDPPVPGDDRYETAEETLLSVNSDADLLENDTDPDRDRLTVIEETAISQAGVSVALSANGRFSYTPPDDFVGTDTFDYTVTDGIAKVDATVTITVTNVAPVADDDDFGDIRFPLIDPELNVFDNDTDGPHINPGTGVFLTGVAYSGRRYLPGSTLDLTCGTLTFTADGVMTIRRTGSIGCSGSGNLTYDMVDSAGATASADVAWNFLAAFDGAVTLSAPPANETGEDEALSVSSGDGVLADAGSVWSVSTTGPLETLFGGSAAVSADGAVSYTPPPNFTGTDSFAFTATGDDPPAQGRVVVTVAPADDAPLAQDDRYGAGAGSTLDVLPDAGLLANDVDLDGGALTVTTVVAAGLSGTLGVQPDGAFSYTPPLGAAGSETFTYTVSDGGRSSTAAATLVIDAAVPTAAAYGFATAEDTALARTLAAGASADALSRFGGSVTMGAGGAFTYTPPPNFTGTDSFAYTVTSDGHTAHGLVQITVSAGPDAPLAGDDFYTIGRDTPFSTTAAGGLLANDIDPDGNSLTVTTTGLQTTDAGGEAEIFADGRIVYGPPTGFTGTDRFDYTVDDGTGRGAAATVIITIVP